MLEACSFGYELGEELLGLEWFAVGRIAEVERRRGLARDDVVGDSRFETCDRDDLAELQSLDDRHSRREVEERREPAHGMFERTVREPRPCSVPARPVERQARHDVPEAARVNLEVGRLEDDRQRRLVHGTRPGEERGEGVVLGRELLPPEEEHRQVTRGRPCSRSRASSIATARPPFMSLAPSPCTAPSSMRPGRLPCAGTVS